MKRTLHFVTKLNSSDIQKCNCFWVPSYDLFALLAKQYLPRQRRPAFTDWETRGRLCEKKFSTKKFNSPFWTEVWTTHPPGPLHPTIKNSWMRSWIGCKRDYFRHLYLSVNWSWKCRPLVATTPPAVNPFCSLGALFTSVAESDVDCTNITKSFEEFLWWELRKIFLVDPEALSNLSSFIKYCLCTEFRPCLCGWFVPCGSNKSEHIMLKDLKD